MVYHPPDEEDEDLDDVSKEELIDEIKSLLKVVYLLVFVCVLLTAIIGFLLAN